LLRPLLTKWYECAQQLNDSEMSVKLLVEMLAAGSSNFMSLSSTRLRLKDLSYTGTEADGEDSGALVANLLTLFRVSSFRLFV
jgi:hypothetical protein